MNLRKLSPILAAAVPFAFGIIRLMRTGSDYRGLVMAIAAFIGAAVLLALPARRGRRPFARFALTFVLSLLLASPDSRWVLCPFRLQ